MHTCDKSDERLMGDFYAFPIKLLVKIVINAALLENIHYFCTYQNMWICLA